ncbi:MAG: AAA family ATPase [Desulfobacterales bacterium]
MGFNIALAGKGGTGKTTVAGLLIKYLLKTSRTPVLAVDADSNANLNEVLGLEITDTLGQAREDMKKGNVPSGMTKDVFISMRLEQAVMESGDYDLIVMGQPEGAGCYCAANTLLTNFLDRMQENYPYVVMDNEAGMEHVSRMTTKNVDVLLIVTDASRRGLQAALRIHELAQNLNVGVGKSYIIINQVKSEAPEAAVEMIRKAGVEFGGVLPEDDTVYDYDFKGNAMINLPEDNPVVQAAFDVFEKILETESAKASEHAVS